MKEPVDRLTFYEQQAITRAQATIDAMVAPTIDDAVAVTNDYRD